ncbi:MAG: hypothetical protein CVU53_03830, partial [Deltaproteobacteria bacterium HGW-Deltaproteobacteria-11]
DQEEHQVDEKGAVNVEEHGPTSGAVVSARRVCGTDRFTRASAEGETGGNTSGRRPLYHPTRFPARGMY